MYYTFVCFLIITLSATITCSRVLHVHIDGETFQINLLSIKKREKYLMEQDLQLKDNTYIYQHN